jgi:hypothetical protein
MAQLSRGSILNLQKHGDYFEKIDYSLVDDGVDPEYRFEYGLEMLLWAQVMAYRTDAFAGTVPNSWADFWDTKKFPGDRAMIGRRRAVAVCHHHGHRPPVAPPRHSPVCTLPGCGEADASGAARTRPAPGVNASQAANEYSHVSPLKRCKRTDWIG